MNRLIALFTVFAVPAMILAQASDQKIVPRFGIEADKDKFPQTTPKDALRSVVKAIDAKRFDYALAHLVDPAFVDKRFKDANDKFSDLVKEAAKKYEGDPEAIRQLRKFLSDGEFPDPQGNDTIEVKCPDVKGKQLFMKKVGTRWYLMDRTHAEKSKEKEPQKEKQKEPEND